MNSRILMLVPRPQLAEELSGPIRAQGLQVDVVAEAEEALARLGRGSPDLMVMDVEGLNVDASEALRRARAASRIPIIVLGAGDEIEEIVALELGADDYAAKPLTGRLLLARVRSCLRRAAHTVADAAAAPQRLQIDPVEREVRFDGSTIELPPSEFDLLRLLAERAGHVVERAQLARALGERAVQARTVDSAVCRLRKNLARQGAEAISIRAVTGLGYRLAITAAGPAPGGPRRADYGFKGLAPAATSAEALAF